MTGDSRIVKSQSTQSFGERLILLIRHFFHSQIGTLPTVIRKLEAQAELKKTTDLEYTVFHCLYLMDYWGMPGVKSHMSPMTLVLDSKLNL